TSLHRLAGGEQREKLIKELLPERNQGESITIQGLRYKPETLFVAKLINKASGDTEGLVKFYREYDYLHAKRAAEIFGSKGSLVIPKLLVSSEKNHALVFGWEAGRPLDEAIYQKEFDATTLKRVAKALREIHQQKPQAVEQVQPTREAETLTEAASVLSVISPSLGSKAALVARKLAHLLSQKRPVYSPVHGDFYPGQVLVSPEEKITIVDFDRAILADPARDPGTFCAHLERDFINGRLAYSKMVTLKENLIEGYLEDIEEELDIRVRIQLYTAAELFRLAREPFRTREKDWTKSTEFLLCRAEMFIEDLLPRSITPQKGAGVPVTYPFEIKKTSIFPCSMTHSPRRS
ncbi:MAG: aminoglycoside phosphotransferase family protein, partial [Nitrospinota bacterium]